MRSRASDNPDSILDFSCITDLFDYRSFDIHFDPAGALEHILDLARRRICAAARDAYRRYVGRALDPSVYVSEHTRPLGPPSRPRYRLAEGATSSMTWARATPAASCSGMR